jgi:hypothetical protein
MAAASGQCKGMVMAVVRRDFDSLRTIARKTPTWVCQAVGGRGGAAQSPAHVAQSPTTRRRRVLRWPDARARRRGFGQDARDHREDRVPDPRKNFRRRRSPRSPSPTRPRARCASASASSSRATTWTRSPSARSMRSA